LASLAPYHNECPIKGQLVELAALVFFFGTGISELLYDPFFAQFIANLDGRGLHHYVNATSILADDSNNRIAHYVCAVGSQECINLYKDDVLLQRRNAMGLSPLNICIARNAYAIVLEKINALPPENAALGIGYVLALMKVIALMAEDGCAREAEAWADWLVPAVGWGTVTQHADFQQLTLQHFVATPGTMPRFSRRQPLPPQVALQPVLMDQGKPGDQLLTLVPPASGHFRVAPGQLIAEQQIALQQSGIDPESFAYRVNILKGLPPEFLECLHVDDPDPNQQRPKPVNRQAEPVDDQALDQVWDMVYGDWMNLPPEIRALIIQEVHRDQQSQGDAPRQSQSDAVLPPQLNGVPPELAYLVEIWAQWHPSIQMDVLRALNGRGTWPVEVNEHDLGCLRNAWADIPPKIRMRILSHAERLARENDLRRPPA
jgi:hypothetical protein